MKPSLLNYICGHTFLISTLGGSIAFLVMVGAEIWHYAATSPSVFKIVSFDLLIAVSIIVSVPLGWFLGGTFIWPVMFAIATRINGGPYKVGDVDTVCVLVGPYRGKSGPIYEVWDSRNQVRVDIGEQEKKDVKDVFFYNEVYRMK